MTDLVITNKWLQDQLVNPMYARMLNQFNLLDTADKKSRLTFNNLKTAVIKPIQATSAHIDHPLSYVLKALLREYNVELEGPLPYVSSDWISAMNTNNMRKDIHKDSQIVRTTKIDKSEGNRCVCFTQEFTTQDGQPDSSSFYSYEQRNLTRLDLKEVEHTQTSHHLIETRLKESDNKLLYQTVYTQGEKQYTLNYHDHSGCLESIVNHKMLELHKFYTITGIPNRLLIYSVPTNELILDLELVN